MIGLISLIERRVHTKLCTCSDAFTALEKGARRSTQMTKVINNKIFGGNIMMSTPTQTKWINGNEYIIVSKALTSFTLTVFSPTIKITITKGRIDVNDVLMTTPNFVDTPSIQQFTIKLNFLSLYNEKKFHLQKITLTTFSFEKSQANSHES